MSDARCQDILFDKLRLRGKQAGGSLRWCCTACREEAQVAFRAHVQAFVATPEHYPAERQRHLAALDEFVTELESLAVFKHPEINAFVLGVA